MDPALVLRHEIKAVSLHSREELIATNDQGKRGGDIRGRKRFQ